MRTLHIDAGREMRGGQWQVLRLLRGLAAQGDRPVLMAREDSPLFRLAKETGIDARRLSVLALPQLARQSDLVHVHDARSHAFASLFRRAPLVVSRRVAFPVGADILSRRKYARATHYIAVSRYVAAVLVGGGVPEAKITVIPDGVPLLPLSDRTGPVITPASNDPLKGVRLVLEAARRLRIQVVPSGDLERDLTTASIFIYVSHTEGLGSAVLLAMSAGIPVVASSVGGIPEAIRDREDGLLVKNEPAAIAAAIRELVDDPAFARQLGARARQKIEMQFTEDLMVERTRGLYRKLLDHV
ncbi:MAG: glycosyl transferase, group 1 [Bryobacterales bacterium]|nr:glycosyl transferase, group 1 [Bryobacterales bacterium]